MIRKFPAVLLLAAGMSPAFAADLKTPPPIYKAPDVVAPAYDPWTGFYIGGAVGYGWDRGSGTGTAATDLAAAFTSLSTAPQGFVGGIHAGAGTRFGSNWYAGVEAAGGIGSLNGTSQNPGFVFGSVNNQTHWLVSLSGRFGFIFTPNVLAYGKGGWSWAGAEFTATDITSGNTFSAKPVLDGPLLGAGIEWAVTQNLIAGLEYNHYFLGDINASTVIGGAVFSTRVSNNVDAVLARLSYKF